MAVPSIRRMVDAIAPCRPGQLRAHHPAARRQLSSARPACWSTLPSAYRALGPPGASPAVVQARECTRRNPTTRSVVGGGRKANVVLERQRSSERPTVKVGQVAQGRTLTVSSTEQTKQFHWEHQTEIWC